MKNRVINNLFIGATCLLTFACSDTERMSDIDQLATTRIASETSNSNLINDWENEIKVRTSFGKDVNLPWAPGAPVDIKYYEFFNDIKKEDGLL